MSDPTTKRPAPTTKSFLLLLLLGGGTLRAQVAQVVEDFEFATSDAAAAAGVIDLTDPGNQPAFYINGLDENASEGLYSIGTDAVFCQSFCDPGSFIGFRRLLDAAQFPQTCPLGGAFALLRHTYGDPAHPGPRPPDLPLDTLAVVTDAYGDGAFADGLTGTHLWINLVDCEGEVYEFVNHSEAALYSEFWTFNVAMGQTFARLSPGSLSAVPDGDRLLTEIAAIEVLIQDADSPPTTIGKWYVDYLRVIEPGALTATGAASRYLAVTAGTTTGDVALLVRGDAKTPQVACLEAYVQPDGELGPRPAFQSPAAWGTTLVHGAAIRPMTRYEILLDSGAPGDPMLSLPTEATTWLAGEVDGSAGVTTDDLQCVIDAFRGVFKDCAAVASDVGGCNTGGVVDLDDLLFSADALLGQAFACPAPCP